MELIENLILDEERALYGLKHTAVKNCIFKGPSEGESALKECRDIYVSNCTFDLRYPFWHVKKAEIAESEMSINCRAPLWYSESLSVIRTKIHGVKALRECRNIKINFSDFESAEFGWFSKNISIHNSSVKGEYPFFQCKKLNAENLNLTGKYSFQYSRDVDIKKSVLDTKDAFWHAKNVTVYDSFIKGEYLGWYSENLRLVRCRIEGTQPLCYAKNLILEDCEMIDCDLAFERSSVNAKIKGGISSIKNPLSGSIEASSIGETIIDGTVKSSCIIK